MGRLLESAEHVLQILQVGFLPQTTWDDLQLFLESCGGRQSGAVGLNPRVRCSLPGDDGVEQGEKGDSAGEDCNRTLLGEARFLRHCKDRKLPADAEVACCHTRGGRDTTASCGVVGVGTSSTAEGAEEPSSCTASCKAGGVQQS